MLKIFYRKFYILLFLIWLLAIAGIFIFSVWGDFGTFVNDFGKIIRTEKAEIRAEFMVKNGTDTAGNQTGMVRSTNGSGDHGIGNYVRRNVVHDVRVVEKDVRVVEKDVEAFLGDKKTAPAPLAPKKVIKPPVKKEIPLKPSGEVNVVNKITFIPRDDSFLARLETAEKAGRITHFWMAKPTRLVVDLRGEWKKDIRNVYRFKGNFINKIIVGIHPDRLRLVFLFTEIDIAKGDSPAIAITPEGLDIIVDNPAK
ncbi:hypothetical protein [Desulfovibrio gilichinskyi]|uniref:AMIN domain-containing protein n=1 Tax=Desulfovibrio gilichinskyi TaxID=1519643 RepID=A0A1X7D6C3_9BACT|nr:hypothetical protein [Desulfovibrio gilichinskyi]SMF09629.1 hypothetical protein SAMN06295933_1710 [Desulfovibrio gilichinskyi]